MKQIQFISSFVISILLLPSMGFIDYPNIDIFLLAGQSNMGGKGGVVHDVWDGYVPPECDPNPAILRLNKLLAWEEAREPLHRDIDYKDANGIGPGMPFATTLLKRDPYYILNNIGLVPAAVAGTTISQWQRGHCLYNRFLARAEAAVLRGGIIRAMLWYQGEADTATSQDAIKYKTLLKQFFTDIRTDLFLPSLPIIQVALASGSEGANVSDIDIVRKAQLELKLPCVKCVDAKGLELEPDGIHLTTASQVQLGEMLADAFLQI
ncbi:hypothetical protein OROGR_022679 [Orobanche gracilis]